MILLVLLRIWRKLSVSHRRAAWLGTATVILILADSGLYSIAAHLPYWHGIYVILANAETFGGDVAPSGLGYVANFIVEFPLIPMVAIAFALLTSGFLEGHVKRAADAAEASRDLNLRSHKILASLYHHHTGKDHPESLVSHDTDIAASSAGGDR